MARFFVGQRVRVVDCDFLPDRPLVLGAEGVVNAVDTASYLADFGEIGVTLPFGSPETDEYEGFAAHEWTFHPHELEPILPEGHKASEYSLAELLEMCREGATP